MVFKVNNLKRSFTIVNTIIHICHTLFLLLLCSISFAQQTVEGLVLDNDNRQRVGRVLIVNTTTGANVFNNAKGEFALSMKKGDVLVAQRDEYKNDTIRYTEQKIVVFNMKKNSIYIQPVTVVAKKSPEQILAQRQIDYEKAFRMADAGDFFSVGQNGAGLSIGTIYNLLSKEGRNARKLTAYFQKEYEENVIDLKFSRAFVISVTKLEGELLDNFMLRYRPSYSFVQMANNYQMIAYVRSKYEQFKTNPLYKPLPDLEKIEIDGKEN